MFPQKWQHIILGMNLRKENLVLQFLKAQESQKMVSLVPGTEGKVEGTIYIGFAQLI